MLPRFYPALELDDRFVPLPEKVGHDEPLHQFPESVRKNGRGESTGLYHSDELLSRCCTANSSSGDKTSVLRP
jgi:hypothetical protein